MYGGGMDISKDTRKFWPMVPTARSGSLETRGDTGFMAGIDQGMGELYHLEGSILRKVLSADLMVVR
jgi:hypothetical protein